MRESDFSLLKTLTCLSKAHPWHGVSIGSDAPNIVTCYIEIVPTDTVKYEIDKVSGHLRIDLPQKYSSQCPMPYGFIPQTLCSTRVGQFSSEHTHASGTKGDGDPIDICIITEKQIQHGEVLAKAIPIGGIRMVDQNQADDKIIAVLFEDGLSGHWRDIYECPKNMIERLRHYFLTYKDMPGRERRVGVAEVYGAEEARAVIGASREDYLEQFGDVETFLQRLKEAGLAP